MWDGIGWYGFIGVITTSTTDISLPSSLLSPAVTLYRYVDKLYYTLYLTDMYIPCNQEEEEDTPCDREEEEDTLRVPITNRHVFSM